MILSDIAVCLIAQPHYDITQDTIIHVFTALPDNLSGINAKFIALLDMVVQKCCQQIVCRSNCMKISGKMKIQFLHRYYLSISTAGCTAFDTETGTKRWLSESDHCFFPHSSESFSQSYRGGRLALSGGSRVDCCYQNQFSVGTSLYFFQKFLRKFCFVLAVKLQVICIDANTCRNVRDWFHDRFLCDFNICFHIFPPFIQTVLHVRFPLTTVQTVPYS